jgi:kynurenine formamidase
VTRRIVDLSVEVGTETRSPPSVDLPMQLHRHYRGPGHWQVTSANFGLHTGSHVDTPVHCIADGHTTSQAPLSQLCGEAVVLDCTQVEDEQPVDVDVLQDADRGVDEGDLVLLWTGWSDRWWGVFPDYYTRSPYLTPAAAEWLRDRHPRAVGFDFFEEYCARLTDFGSEDFVCHRILLGAGILLMEQITNLRELDRARVDFYAPFYKVADSDGAPARFFAVLD